jgi:beta-glucanase (GH16 family)
LIVHFHTYAFDWEPGSITWYVDGVKAYDLSGDVPVTPGKIMMNAWNGFNANEESGFNANEESGQT